jgi:hypothetical protein
MYPVATLEIVDMVAKARGTSSDASTEAEFAVRDKVSPFMILETWAEAVAVDKTTNYGAQKLILEEITTTLISSDGKKTKASLTWIASTC